MDKLAGVLGPAISVALQSAAANGALPEIRGAPPVLVREVTEQAATALSAHAPAIEQALTPIPFWQSGVLNGQIVAAVGLAMTVLGKNVDMGQVTQVVSLGMTLIGIAVTVWSRLKSKAAPVTAS